MLFQTFLNVWYKPLDIALISIFGTNVCMSKYKKEVLGILSREKIKSTNEILKELENKVSKVINWHMLHRILRDLEDEGKIQKLNAKAGFFWKKR
jgi:hypothetical protein